MVAGRCYRLQIRSPRIRARDQSDVAPRLMLLKPVERMTSAYACLASGADVQIDGKCILLTPARLRGRNQITVIAGLRGNVRALVLFCEALDRGEPLLLGEKLIDKINFESDPGHSWKSTCSEFTSCRVVKD